jgi:murein DD-endopeptidase MepM/ murein hydrolase activator NlpD
MQTRSEAAGSRRTQCIAVPIATAAVLLLSTAPAPAARPPLKKTYFTIILGMESPFAWGAECLSFTATEMCTRDGLCGSWNRTESTGAETAIEFELEFVESGAPVVLQGQATFEDQGKNDSLAAVALGRFGGDVFNFSFAGRSTTRKKCSRLLKEWSRDKPPGQATQSASCLQRADFETGADSPYILPFPVGKDYRVSQTYCSLAGGHSTQLAYDFAIPVGPKILAARGGVVREVREDLPDDGRGDDPGQHNHVFIEHADGSVAFYAHLQQQGVRVEEGDRVEIGQVIATSGNSGMTGGPHLHFGVYRRWPPQEGDDLTVSFRNALGPLDRRGGLIQNVYYQALRD